LDDVIISTDTPRPVRRVSTKLTLKELGLKASKFKKNSTEKSLFKEKIKAIIEKLSLRFKGPLTESCFFATDTQIDNITNIGFNF